MTQPMKAGETKLSWRFPGVFWVANVAELFERGAFYAMFILLTVYLTDVVGYSDPQSGLVVGIFSSLMFFFPMFAGALADKIGYRFSLMLAFALLGAGYALLGAFPGKVTSVLALAVIVGGGVFVKPVIAATVAKCSDERHRARAFSVFYWMINIGSFSGKTFAAPIRNQYGLEYVDYFSAAVAFAAFLWVACFFRNIDRGGPTKTFAELIHGFVKVIRNLRFMVLILIVAGFWIIQGQLYAAMPKYILRLVGPEAKPEWLANVNPFVVVLCVMPITHLIRNFKPENGIGLGLFIIPFSALAMSLSPTLESAVGKSVSVLGLFSLHSITVMVILGIAIQGLAECFLSPKFLEFASRQAPPGEEGLYMGYQHLTTFFAWFAGFWLSGHLLDRFCPDPAKLPPEVHAQWESALKTGSALPEVYAQAHYIWYIYAAIGVFAFLSLCAFRWVTRRMDQARAE